VVEYLLGPVPDGTAVFYQKHMNHHLLPHIDRGWVHQLTNIVLIRDPREVVASYVRARASVTPEDIGLPQQVVLYDELASAGTPPPVVDAADFLREPEAYLRAICERVGLEFTEKMLSWPAGPSTSPGVRFFLATSATSLSPDPPIVARAGSRRYGLGPMIGSIPAAPMPVLHSRSMRRARFMLPGGQERKGKRECIMPAR
jgi:hypothetical protein